jgi:hypothetical protein
LRVESSTFCAALLTYCVSIQQVKWDFVRAIGLKNRELERTEDPKILKSRRTKVVSNDIKHLSGGYRIRFSRKRKMNEKLCL